MSDPNYLLNDDGLPPLVMPTPDEVRAFRQAMGPSRTELPQIANSHYQYRQAADAFLRECARVMQMMMDDPHLPPVRTRVQHLIDSINEMPELPTNPEAA
jgi:hypothetical protein